MVRLTEQEESEENKRIMAEVFGYEIKKDVKEKAKGGSLGLGQEKTDVVVPYADENKALIEQCV